MVYLLNFFLFDVNIRYLKRKSVEKISYDHKIRLNAYTKITHNIYSRIARFINYVVSFKSEHSTDNLFKYSSLVICCE